MAARPTVVLELAADAKYARELTDGAVYVAGCQLAPDSVCELVVRGAMDEAVFDARVVHLLAGEGAALELLGFCPAMKQQLESLIAATPITQRMEKLDQLGSEYDDLVRDVAALDGGLAEADGNGAPDEADGNGAPDEADEIHEFTPWPDEVHASGPAPWTDDAPVPVHANRPAPWTDDAPVPVHASRPAPWTDDAPARPRAARLDGTPDGGRRPAPWLDDTGAVPEGIRRQTPWPGDVSARARPTAHGTDQRQLTQQDDSDEPAAWNASPPPSELSTWADAIPASPRDRSAWAETRPPAQRESSQWGNDADPSALSPWGEDDDLAVPVEVEPDGALSVDDLDDDDDEPVMIHAGRLDESSEITLDEPLPLPTLDPLTEPVQTLDLEDLVAPDDPLDALDLDDDDDGGRARPAPSDDEGDEGEERGRAALTVHERLRRLSLAEQLKKAHSGELQERIVLERMYGKTVWEPLLRNPRITAPEVARIARMGQLPKPLLELIVGNGAWLQVPEVRRALLSNPRLATDQIMRVLRMLPKHELRLAAVQTAYAHGVRDVAKRMLKESS